MVEMHDSVFLHCITLGTPLPLIVWTLNESVLTNGSNITISHEVISSGGVLFSKSLLQICDTGGADVGVYSCRSENEVGRATFSFEVFINTAGNSAGFLCMLHVITISDEYFTVLHTESPVIVMHPVLLNAVDPGHTVILQCVGYGFPTPHITWTQNGTTPSNASNAVIYKELVNEGGVCFTKSTLEICSVSDPVTYNCDVGNTIGNTTTNIQVFPRAEGN